MVTCAVVFGVATQSTSGDGDWVLLSFYCVSKLSTGWLQLSLSLVWSLTGALTLMWPHLPSLLVPAPRNKRSEPE